MATPLERSTSTSRPPSESSLWRVEDASAMPGGSGSAAAVTEAANQLEQLLCLLEVQRRNLEKELCDVRATAAEERRAAERAVMRLQGELRAALAAAAEAESHAAAAHLENEELLRELGKVEATVEAVKIEIATSSRATTPRSLSPTRSRRMSQQPGSDDGGALGATDSLMHSLSDAAAVTVPQIHVSGPSKEQSRVSDETKRLRELRLLDVIEQSSLVFAEIQQKVYDLQHDLDVANAEVAMLCAERHDAEQKVATYDGLQNLLRDTCREVDEQAVLNLLDAEKYGRVFLHCQFEVVVNQHFAMLQRAVKQQAAREARQRITELESNLDFAEQQFHTELARAAEISEKIRRADAEAHQRDILEKTESYRMEIQNLKITNDLLNENLNEWRAQNREAAHQSELAVSQIEGKHAKEVTQLRDTIAMRDAELRAAEEMKAVLKAQNERLERELEAARDDAADAKKVAGHLKSSLGRVEEQRRAALAAAEAAAANGSPQSSGRSAGHQDTAERHPLIPTLSPDAIPPFLHKPTQAPAKPPSYSEAVGARDDLHEHHVEIPILLPPASPVESGNDLPDNNAHRLVAELRDQVNSLEQVVVSVERDKLHAITLAKAELQQLRYLADAADRAKAEALHDRRAAMEELEVLRAQNAKLQAKLAEHERLLQDKEMIVAAATQSEREAQRHLQSVREHANAERVDMATLIEELEKSLLEVAGDLRRCSAERDGALAAVQQLADDYRAVQLQLLHAEERLGRREVTHKAELYFAQREGVSAAA